MTIQIDGWETRLLNWAYYPLGGEMCVNHVKADRTTLDAAYAACTEITRFHSRTFYLASSLLPEAKRKAVRALYAFCRISDDLVDEAPDGHALAALEQWQRIALQPQPHVNEPVVLAWADARARFDVPLGYAEQLICGVSRDLVQTRYHSFDDLAAYSYGVASTVGLMAMHIIGFTHEEAIPYAVRLGVALQLTNILRDVGEDWEKGRFYLPLEELEEFGLTEADIAAQRIDGRWKAFMRFQIERNRRLYEEAWPGIALLNPEGRFAIAAAAELYRAILRDIEVHDYDVFSRRARIGTLGKLRRLPGIWWRSRTTRADNRLTGWGQSSDSCGNLALPPD